MTEPYRDFYRDRRVMVTGGLGFIGSNLARQLVDLGARVLLVDSLIPDYGGNLFNIDGITDQLTVNIADIRQQSTMNYLVRDRDVIFNLAGQVSHIDSMRDPYSDLEINCRSQLTVLEACRNYNPGVKVVFAGTRQVYGRPDSLPVSEAHLVRPTDVNGINKAAGENYHLVYNNVFGVRGCSLRLTNVYGPRQLIKHNRQGFIGWFIRLAIEDRTISIYGDGSQLRDFVYVDDAAAAFLRAGASDACNGEVFNVGGDVPHSHRELTTLLVEVAGSGRVEYVDWPADKKSIDIGSFYADSSKFKRTVGWMPSVSLAEGLQRTVTFYRQHYRRYVDDGAEPPTGMTVRRVPFMALTPGDDGDAIRDAMQRVVSSGWFVLGPEVEGFEAEFAAAMGARHAVGVGNGTDALMLILRGLGIGPGDEVITTPLSAAYTALAIAMAGATPVFADIDPVRFTIDPERIAAAIGPRTRALLPVHLYGQAADMAAIERLASRHNLAIVEDCCQAHLATAAGRPVGSIGVAGAFSFYPTKNLGALGDGGAIVTRDQSLADRVRRLRNGGQTDRYHHQEPGVNSRLDELQAAILRARLPRLPAWTARRREIAARYRTALADAPVDLPAECDAGHVYHLFVVRARHRDQLQARLAGDGIETLVHYPVPIPRQQAFAGGGAAACPRAAQACGDIVSLPLNHRLTDDDVAAVVAAMRKGLTS